jgi:SAM-dependent methyltransferase
MHKNLKKCRVCNEDSLKRFLDLGEQPLANAFLKSKEDAEKEQKFPLRVCFCSDCNHVQLEDVVDAGLMFYDYVYVSSTSPVFVKHFEDYAQSIFERFSLGEKLVLDIGSNDGVLLKPLKALGARVIGVDPAQDIARRATAEGIETVPDFLSVRVVREIVSKHGRASAVCANNAFAHIDNWEEVMDSLDVLLEDEGVFIVEAPYLLDFIQKKYFDTTYHEHYNYLAIRPLDVFFNRRSYEIFDVKKVNSHGGSIRVFIKRKIGTHKIEASVEEFKKIELENNLDKFSTYEEYAQDIEVIKKKTLEMLKRIKDEGKTIVGYGAAAKGNTLLNYMGLNTDYLDYIVDDSPYKQNLLAPGTHIPVLSSERMLADAPDYVLILAWNFAESIIKKCKDQGLVNSKFIVPLPEPIILN